MYEIRIITSAGERVLDNGEPSFPYTFESANISELQDQSASWSYTITIPRTPTNEAIFEGVGDAFVRTDRPYKRMMCNVHSDGVRIIKDGVMFIDRTTDEAYEVQVVSGNADVFERMGDIEFADEAYPYTRVALPYRDGVPTYTQTRSLGYAYWRNIPLSRDWYNKDERTQLLPSTTTDGVYRYARPFALIGAPNNTKGMLYRLLHRFGLTMLTDTSTTLLNSLYLSMAEDVCLYTGDVSNEDGTPVEMTQNGAVQVEGDTLYPKNNDQTTTEVTIRWKPATAWNKLVSALLRLNLYFDAGGYVILQAVNESNEVLAQQVFLRDTWDDEDTLEATLTFENAEYKSIRPRVVVNGDTQYQYQGYPMQSITYKTIGLDDDGICEAHVRTYLTDADGEPYNGDGATINLEASTGISTPLDFVKMLAQIFGWMVCVKDGVMHAYTFGHIKSNLSHAIDWSDRMVVDKDNATEYEFGEYARINTISYAENEVIGWQERAQFTIPNDRLEERKDVIEIEAVTHQADIVELWERKNEYDEGDGEFDWAGGGGGTHIIKVTPLTQRCEPYTAKEVMSNYAPLINTLQSVQVVTAKMMLTAWDVHTFDPYTPVFLRPLGGYFYVNKISDWEDGKTCNVELLRL